MKYKATQQFSVPAVGAWDKDEEVKVGEELLKELESRGLVAGLEEKAKKAEKVEEVRNEDNKK